MGRPQGHAPATPSQAEEYLALKYLRWALEIDPADAAAQILFVSTAVEKAVQRGGVATPLAGRLGGLPGRCRRQRRGAVGRPRPRYREGRTATALGLAQVLGGRADRVAARTGSLVRALDSGDRRVQLAAAEALVNVPGPPEHRATARVIEVLGRAILGDSGGAEPAPKAVVGDFDAARGEASARVLRQAGYSAEVFRTGQEVLRRRGLLTWTCW